MGRTKFTLQIKLLAKTELVTFSALHALSENRSFLGTESFRGEISESLFPLMEAIVYSFVAAKIRASEKASLYVDLDIASPVQYPKPLCFRKIIEKKNFAFERQDACWL